LVTGWSHDNDNTAVRISFKQQTLERANYLKCIQTTVESMHKG